MNEMFPILIVEDDAVSRRVLERLVSKAGYSVTAAENGLQALKLYQEQFFPIVLTDWLMPEMDGLELCKAIRNIEQEDYVYIILVTQKESKEDIAEGLEAGADDYLTKPVHLIELLARIKTGMRIIELERNLREAKEEVYMLSITDPLTGTYNRRYLNENLSQEIDLARKNKHPLAIILCDIDYFKRVNDTYGHLIGDLVLKSFARILRDAVDHRTDWVARYGGEEFIIVLKESNYENACIVSETLRNFVERATIKVPEAEINITSSFGVTAFEPQNTSQEISLEKMLDLADKCLYQAKTDGRNRVSGECILK